MGTNYRLESRRINLDRLNVQSTFTGGRIYSYRNQIIKVFDDDENHVSENEARTLSRIKALHVFLPSKLLFFNDKFCGYSLKSLDKIGRSKTIGVDKEELLDSIYNLENEFSDLFRSKDPYTTNCDFLDDIIGDSPNVRELVKRM